MSADPLWRPTVRPARPLRPDERFRPVRDAAGLFEQVALIAGLFLLAMMVLQVALAHWAGRL